MTTTCTFPPCRYRLTYGCRCQKPRCRVNSPAFKHNGVGCTQHKPRYSSQ